MTQPGKRGKASRGDKAASAPVAGAVTFSKGRPLRVLTMNLYNFAEPYAARQKLLRAGIIKLDPDVLTFQEAGFDGSRDQVRELLGGLGYHIAHQFDGLKDLPGNNGCCLASRWPLELLENQSLQLTPRCYRYPWAALLARVHGPEPMGPMLLLCAKPSWELSNELEREQQVVLMAKLVEKHAKLEDFPTVIAGDFDATADSSSIRFLTGRQSLAGMSVHYQDAWAQVGDGSPGHTWSDENPMARAIIRDRLHMSRHARRIDYIFLGSFHNYSRFARLRRCQVAFDKPSRGVWPSDHYAVYAEIDVVA